MTPEQFGSWLGRHVKKEWKTAFFSAVLFGLLIHLPVMLGDIPNHDGLASMYFDQNMITSGRWFLMIACGFSSYYTLPWVIGLIGLFFLSCTAAVLTEIFELRSSVVIVLMSGLLVSFPALASTFAYVFTLDGYMMGLFLAALSVLLVKKGRFGFLAGGVCLAFSMGAYQAYVAVAVLLCLYLIGILWMEEGSLRQKIRQSLRYLYMGIIGVGLYYVILQILLKIQGKVLDTYQGINEMSGGHSIGEMLTTVKEMYLDFAGFSLRGGVLYGNVYSGIALAVLVLLAAAAFFGIASHRKWWKHPGFYLMLVLYALVIPLGANLILLISPEVTYHLLMRYQWVILLMILLVLAQRYGVGRIKPWIQWGTILAAAVLVFHYGVLDNIGYSNLQKRYEKTYAYCLRLLDRMEQTPGYYPGIPIAMVGVVSPDQYPLTDITQNDTFNMIGLYGDSLVYKPENYQSFMRHYLGVTLNFLDEEAVTEIYYTEAYVEMDSFPGADSTKVVDGILYVKTENADRD